MKESDKVAKLRKIIGDRAIIYKNTGGPFAKRGRPDLEFVFDHRDTGANVVAFVELKQPGETPSATQLREIANLKAKRANVAWFTNVEDTLDYLRGLGL